MRPLNDQQIAGFISKLTLLLVLLSVGAVVLARAPVSEEEIVGNEPLVWADVEREFERADRHHRDKAPTEPVDSAGRQGSDPGTEPPRHPRPPSPGSGHGLSEHPATNREPPEGDPPDASG
jgi:hypothetical protein